MSTLHVFVKKQRVFMIINHNRYQNILRLTLNFYCAIDVIVLLMHFAHTMYCVFYFVKLFFPKNPLFKSRFEKSFLPFDKTYFIVSFHAKSENGQNVTNCVFTLSGRILWKKKTFQNKKNNRNLSLKSLLLIKVQKCRWRTALGIAGKSQVRSTCLTKPQMSVITGLLWVGNSWVSCSLSISHMVHL